MFRLLPAVLLAAVAGALLATPAFGASVTLGGSPLNVMVGDQGQLQAFRSDRTDPNQAPGIFYQPTRELGDAGFFLAFPTMGPTGTVWGFSGSAGPGLTNQYTAVSQGGVTGSGTAAAPLTQVTVYSAATGDVTVTQTTTYVNGAQEFRIHWDVKNTGASTLTFKAIAAADFFFEGDDAGTGIFTQGPPRFIGGTNVDSGSSGGFVEVSPSWTHYQALDFPTVWQKVRDAASTSTATPVWDDTVLDHPADNAGGVEWDAQSLAANATSSYELVVRSAVPSALQLNPTNAGSRQGVPVAITATATDSNGQPYAGKTLRYTIAGPNATTGSTTLGAAGTAVVTDPGTNAGTDNVTVFVDFNNDGVREPIEPQATALATFVDSVPPTCTINVSGTLPGGGGSGKPLVINVKCGEGATVTMATSLQPPASGHRAASAAKTKKKRKPKKIKLKTRTVAVAAGRPAAVKLAIPKSVARKYAGKTLTATVVITARDAAGNVKKTTIKRKVKLAKIKKKKSRRH